MALRERRFRLESFGLVSPDVKGRFLSERCRSGRSGRSRKAIGRFPTTHENTRKPRKKRPFYSSRHSAKTSQNVPKRELAVVNTTALETVAIGSCGRHKLGKETPRLDPRHC